MLLNRQRWLRRFSVVFDLFLACNRFHMDYFKSVFLNLKGRSLNIAIKKRPFLCPVGSGVICHTYLPSQGTGTGR